MFTEKFEIVIQEKLWTMALPEVPPETFLQRVHGKIRNCSRSLTGKIQNFETDWLRKPFDRWSFKEVRSNWIKSSYSCGGPRTLTIFCFWRKMANEWINSQNNRHWNRTAPLNGMSLDLPGVWTGCPISMLVYNIEMRFEAVNVCPTLNSMSWDRAFLNHRVPMLSILKFVVVSLLSFLDQPWTTNFSALPHLFSEISIGRWVKIFVFWTMSIFDGRWIYKTDQGDCQAHMREIWGIWIFSNHLFAFFCVKILLISNGWHKT